jgi:biotin carboxyl carrier protein
MRYLATLKGKKEAVPVDLEIDGTHRYVLTLDGVKHVVDAQPVGEGALSLLIDGASYDVELHEREDEVEVDLGLTLTRVDVADERQAKLRAGTARFHAEGRQVILAPMPGKVVKLLVRAGDEVKEGQGLVVVEAMKMENELKSPKAGKVIEVHAQEGQAVENNAKLLTVE